MFEEVQGFIETNILHSGIWDSADTNVKRKAVNNAERNLSNYYKNKKELPAEAIAYQALWLLKIDDSIQRAEQGATSISVSGMSVSLLNIDRSIAPEVLRMLGRRVGRYSVPIEGTFRHRNTTYRT